MDVHRRAAEQSRRAHEELKAQYELEAEDRTQNREATQTWSTACMRICARLEQQHNFCMRVLGKADGREEMDGLLDQIKANPAMRGSPKKPIAERSREAVDSLDRVVSQLEEHISDMAEELARCGASSLGSNVIAQLEDRIEQLQAQLDEERAAGTATGEHSVLERARAAEEELAVCAHTLALLAALLPPRGTLDHSMSVPLAELHAAFSAPAGAEKAACSSASGTDMLWSSVPRGGSSAASRASVCAHTASSSSAARARSSTECSPVAVPAARSSSSCAWSCSIRSSSCAITLLPSELAPHRASSSAMSLMCSSSCDTTRSRLSTASRDRSAIGFLGEPRIAGFALIWSSKPSISSRPSALPSTRMQKLCCCSSRAQMRMHAVLHVCVASRFCVRSSASSSYCALSSSCARRDCSAARRCTSTWASR